MATIALRSGQPISEVMTAPDDVIRAMTAIWQEQDQGR